jgi:ATP-dependent Clp protease ATP-binding subunit ClpC
MSYLNRFSRDTNDIIKNARQIAEDNRQSYISTTHFLMGILAHRENFACEILEELDFDIMEFYESIKMTLQPDMSVAKTNDALLFTPDIKKVFELAEEEMKKTKRDAIDSVHLLLALSKCKVGDIIYIFEEVELTYDEIMNQYQDLMRELDDAGLEPIGATPEGNMNSNTTKNGKQSSLNTYGRNLSQLARENKLDPVIGRDDEIKRCWRILARRKKNNAILTGGSGVGKSAIAEGIANCIAKKEVPQKLANKEIYLLDVNGMVAGSKFRGHFKACSSFW